MKRNIDLGLLVLRVGLAALLLTHGIPKLLEFIGGNMAVVGDPIGIGGLITTLLVILAEFIAPVLNHRPKNQDGGSIGYDPDGCGRFCSACW